MLPQQEAAGEIGKSVDGQSKDFENSTSKTQSLLILIKKRGRRYLYTSDNKIQNVCMKYDKSTCKFRLNEVCTKSSSTVFQ